jgi:acyl carrier protein
LPATVASSPTKTSHTRSETGPSGAELLERFILAALATMASVDRIITRDAQLSALEIDSLDLVELTQILEEEHEVTLAPSSMKGLTTIGEVIDLILIHAAGV